MMTTSAEQSGAFVELFELPPYRSGPLDGLTFAVKDLIDLAGRVTGCGNPTWWETHPPAAANAVAVDQLLAAGGRCVGKTLTDQLAFSLDGENYFYGTPLNPRAPNRVPGGSSSGSASAVACELADMALGTDTGGSIRIPAHNCGIYGFRPSHGRISVAGVMPFAPTYDTVGVLARDVDVLERTARVLLGNNERSTGEVRTLHLLAEPFALADAEVRDALAGRVARLREQFGERVRETSLREVDGVAGAEGLGPWFEAFHVVQWAEIWSSLGAWVEEHHPAFGPRTERNFGLVQGLDRSRLANAVLAREQLFRALDRFLGPRDLLCMPTGPCLAPPKGSLPADRSAGGYYPRTVSFIAISGVGRVPEVSMPLAETGGVPVGLSLLGKHGEDIFLLDVVRRLV